MKNLIQYTFVFLLTIGANCAMAHGGEDHGDAKPKVSITNKNYFTTSGVSDVYELLLRYEPIKSNEDTHLKLFVSDFDSNKPVDSATIEITSPDDDKLKFEVHQLEKGVYEIHTTFPENKIYSLTIDIKSAP